MIDDPNIEYEPNQEFDENGEPIFYIEKDYTADEFTSYNFKEEPPAFPDSYYESVWDTGTEVSALAADETTGEELTDRIELEDELKDSVDSQQENTINQAEESYNNAVDTIINVLTEVLSKGEITSEDNATILQAQSTIAKTEEQIKQVCNDYKNINITAQLENIKENMVGATIDDILNILTVNGTKPWLYKDDNNNVLVDMQSIPELTVLVNKLNLIATGGDDAASEIQVTPEFINLVCNNDTFNSILQLKADEISSTLSGTFVTKTEVEKTLKSVTNEYYISTSNTELIDGSWSTTVPTPQDNKYIWRRERSEFVDGSITYGDPICLTNEGDDGYTILLTKDTITCVWDSSGDLGGGGDSGGDNPSGGDSPALTISNISAKSIIEGAAFGISYTTNKAVSKHYISWNASSSSPTYTNITSYVSSSGNSHQYLENDNTQAVGTYNVAIKVVTTDGESKVSNVFTITITKAESGGDSGGETGSDLTGTYLFFGDSICYGGGTGGYGYPQAIKAKQPLMTSLNYSKSGTCIARNDSYDVKYPSILSKIQGTSIAADYVILEGGVNDSWGNRNPIGTFKGGTAPTTSSAMISYGNSLNEYQFADALEKCIIEIKLKWWGKKVFYVIPHPINQSYSNPYFNLAIQICNKWGVKVIDLRNSGCTSADTTDGTHPTRAAYDNYYAPNIINVLKANK